MNLKVEFSEKYRLDFSNFKALVRLHCLQAERAESAGDRIKMLHQVWSLFEHLFPQRLGVLSKGLVDLTRIVQAVGITTDRGGS